MHFYIATDLDHALTHGAQQQGPDLFLEGRPVLTLASLRAGILRDTEERTRYKAHLLPGLQLTLDDRAELYRAGAWIYR